MLIAKPILHNLVTKNISENQQNFNFLNFAKKKTANEDETKLFINLTIKPVYQEMFSDETFIEISDYISSTLSTFTASGRGWIRKQNQKLFVKKGHVQLIRRFF